MGKKKLGELETKYIMKYFVRKDQSLDEHLGNNEASFDASGDDSPEKNRTPRTIKRRKKKGRESSRSEEEENKEEVQKSEEGSSKTAVKLGYALRDDEKTKMTLIESPIKKGLEQDEEKDNDNE